MPTGMDRWTKLWSAVFLLVGAASAAAEGILFGYAGIACGHDDPLDNQPVVDYAAEVAGFSNANQVCVDADLALTAARLQAAARDYRPILLVEPALFAFDDQIGSTHPQREPLWALVRQAIADSGVDAAQIIFYLVDEPTLRGVSAAAVAEASDFVRRYYPHSQQLLIEAYHGPAAPQIPVGIDLWGFNAYTVPDPLLEPRYVDYMLLAESQLRPHQGLVVVMDGSHTPAHQAVGIQISDMAAVAHAYERLARRFQRTEMVLVYAWPSGIDGLYERGVRLQPKAVLAAHREIGRRLIRYGLGPVPK